MKFVVAFAVLALASQCLAAPSAVKDEYKDLIIDVLTYAKQQLSAHDPMTFPPVKGQKIKTQDLDLVVDQANTQISKASTFTVEDVTTDPDTLTATVKINVPEVLETYDFNVAGLAFGKKVSGSGSASISAKGIKQSITVTLVNPDTSVQISKLVLDYDVDSLTVDETGLKVEGMTDEQVKQLVSKKLVDYILSQKAEVEAATAKALQVTVNNAIAGKTLAEVAAYVKNLIHQ